MIPVLFTIQRSVRIIQRCLIMIDVFMTIRAAILRGAPGEYETAALQLDEPRRGEVLVRLVSTVRLNCMSPSTSPAR